MRKFTLTPLFGALLALTPAATAQMTVPQLEAQVSSQFDSMQDQVSTGSVTARDITRLSNLIGQWADRVGPTFPSACELETRLQHVVSGLTERATSAFLRMEHVAEAQEQWIDSLIDRKMFQLRQAVTKGRLNRKLYYKIVRLLHKRAEAAVDDPNAQAIRDRLISAVDDVMANVRTAIAELHNARVLLIRARYERAKSLLTKYAQNHELTRQDYYRVLNLWADLSKAAANESFFPSCEG